MKKIIILIPIYNDWKSLSKLLKEIDLQVVKWEAAVSILVVNDASTEKKEKIDTNFENIKSIKIINMIKNRGHARCYASGLKFIIEKEDFDYIILMDGDGEDQPSELNLIFNKSKENPTKVITANRVKRSESVLFKILYECHKFLTYAFAGRLIRFGNFGCLPKIHAIKLIKNASIWSSYSGTLTKVINERMSVPSFRGYRYFGSAQMNYFNLLIHSLCIIAVFKRTVLIRSIAFLFFYLFFVFNNISIITFLPVIIIFIFLLSIFKISARENMEEFNKSLENIESIDTLTNFDSRQ